MSGHSKWHQIKYKKGITDVKKGKIFTKHGKIITIAVRAGGTDPVMNPSLRSAIINARADNMPNANIEKAIKKGSGEDKDSMQMSEVMYEGFGPAGVALYVQVITDNTNRAFGSIRTVFSKNGGNIGAAGSIGWLFEKKGVIMLKAGKKTEEEAELSMIDAGADDFSAFGDNEFEVLTVPANLMKVRDNLEKSGFEISKAELKYLPKNSVKVDSLEEAKKIFNLIDALEDEDDVANVFGNFDIPSEIMEKL